MAVWSGDWRLEKKMIDDPFLPLVLGFQVARIGLEAQSVIAMRVAGMAGLWNTPPGEMNRMVAEKAYAAIEATTAATQATLQGHGPIRAFQAGVAEIGRHTSANVKRLGHHGPAIGARGK